MGPCGCQAWDHPKTVRERELYGDASPGDLHLLEAGAFINLIHEKFSVETFDFIAAYCDVGVVVEISGYLDTHVRGVGCAMLFPRRIRTGRGGQCILRGHASRSVYRSC